MYRGSTMKSRAVNVTQFRSHLPEYLSKVQSGCEILVTSHGKVIARILPPIDAQANAKKQLKLLRTKCKMGDVISPTDEEWDVDK